MKIQECMDLLNSNLIKSHNNIKPEITEPETWNIIRWLAIELEEQGICIDNYQKITREICTDDL